MNDIDFLSAVLEEIHKTHGQQMVGGGDELFDGLERTLKMLPEDGVEWMVAKPTLAVLARSACALFQIVLNTERKTVTLTSRPVDGGKLAVGLAWGKSSIGQGISSRDTNWTFRYVCQKGEMQEWQRITGRVTFTNRGDYVDRRERFARGLAEQAGWEPPAGQEAT